MTGPNPDAELDEALGVTHLPPAAATEEHRAEAHRVWNEALCNSGLADWDRLAAMAQALADAEQRGAARVLATHAAAGAPLRDDERAELDRLRAFTASTMGRHAYTPWLLSRGEHPDQLRHRPPGRPR